MGKNMLKNPHELATGEEEGKKGRNPQLVFKFEELNWHYEEIPKEADIRRNESQGVAGARHLES